MGIAERGEKLLERENMWKEYKLAVKLKKKNRSKVIVMKRRIESKENMGIVKGGRSTRCKEKIVKVGEDIGL